MTSVYIDTSAAAKLLVEEAESEALAEWIDVSGVQLVATHLLETELRRVAVRDGLPQLDVSEILRRIDLHDVPASLYREAGLLPGATLRSLDALHLAAALRLDVAAVMTYDERFAEAATSVGIHVVAPS